MNADERQQLLQWSSGQIDGSLTPKERDQLEQLLQQDQEARRTYTDFLHLHATLHWSGVGDQIPETLPTAADTSPLLQRPFVLALAAAVVALLMIIGTLSLHLSGSPDPTFAVMKETKAARWESGNLPTSRGARLGPGILRLAEGLATLEFDSGASLSLEAPAVLEILDGMHCLLNQGTIVADIPEEAIGFTVRTPTANVVDYGTNFAVTVDASAGTTQTEVFQGLVEVEHRTTSETVRLETGQRSLASTDRFEAASPRPEEGTYSVTSPRRFGSDWHLFTTASAGGEDAYIASRVHHEHQSDVLLLLKNGGPNGYSRKAYLAFDLSSLDRAAMQEAELVLHFAPTGWGLASKLPDCEFTVYGVTDPSLNRWQADALSWQNAPAQDPSDGHTVHPELVARLGSFIVPEGVQKGEFSLRNEKLTSFLRQESSSRSTLIIVRDTPGGERGGDLVHGFASHRHPTLPAPILAIRMR
ncbi:MAG: DNRLRE domain-containing protein [Verrucomicrobiota bacterium]